MGSNLSQVFIDNTKLADADAGGSNFNDLVGTPASVEAGFFDVRGQAFLDEALFATTIEDGSNDNSTDEIAVSGGLWKFSHLQVAQGISGGNSIATPIIPTAAIKSLSYQHYVATTRSKVHLDGTLVTSKDYAFRFVIRTSPIAYSNFANNVTAGIKDLSGGNFDFPLGAFNTTNHKVITITVEASEHDDVNIEDCGDKLKEKIEAHGILNKLVTVTKTNTGATAEYDIEARHPHVEIELAIENTTDEENAIGTSKFDATQAAKFKPGSGNDWQVLSDEMRTRAKYGNFNRMHFPTDQTQYTIENNQYDTVTINYATPNWPVGAGIAPAGALNTVRLYVGGAAAPTVSTTELDTVLGVSIGTAKNYFWS